MSECSTGGGSSSGWPLQGFSKIRFKICLRAQRAKVFEDLPARERSVRRSECKTRYTTCVHSVYTPGHIPRVCTPLGDSCVLHSQLTYASVPTHMYGCLSCLSFETLSCPSPFSPGPGPRLSRTELTKRFMLMREAIRPARPGDPPETRDIFSKIFQKFACVNRDLPCQNLPLRVVQKKSLYYKGQSSGRERRGQGGGR